VIRWSAGRALEDEIVINLPDRGLKQLVAAAINERGEETVRASIEAQLDDVDLVGRDPTDWLKAAGDDGLTRAAVAAAAKGKKPKCEERETRRSWFKRESGGEILAELIMTSWAAVEDTSLGAGIVALKGVVYTDPVPQPAPMSERPDGRH
jgi:putative ATP-dependent endonuclease of OLD family